MTQAPILVILGGKEYEIKPLVIKESRKWREKVVKLLGSLPQYMGETSEKPEVFEKALQALLVTSPNIVIDLFFDYAKGLDRKEIESTATDAELAKAWWQIVEVSFPLAQSLLSVMTKAAQ